MSPEPAALAIVPARLAASRLPGKPLRDLQGRPLVVHVLDRVRAASLVSEVVLATPDEALAEVVASHGYRVVRTANAPSGTHRCRDALDRLGVDSGLVLNVQGDQPLLDPRHLDQLIPRIRSVATLAAPLFGDPSDPRRVKVVTDHQGRALYFSREAIPRGGPHALHVGVYGFTVEALRRCADAPRGPLCLAEDLEQLAWLEAGESIDVVRIAGSEPPVDDEADLERVRAILRGGVAHTG